MSRLSVVGEFWTFLRARKKLWMLPLIMLLLVLGLVIALTAKSALAPLIYSVF